MKCWKQCILLPAEEQQIKGKRIKSGNLLCRVDSVMDGSKTAGKENK